MLDSIAQDEEGKGLTSKHEEEDAQLQRGHLRLMGQGSLTLLGLLIGRLLIQRRVHCNGLHRRSIVFGRGCCRTRTSLT